MHQLILNLISLQGTCFASLRRQIIILIAIIAITSVNSVFATTDLGTLASPNLTIYPNSGPPGTKVTVLVWNLPDITNESYPYPDLYIYMPFSEPFGLTVPSHCSGEDCFPVYTHDDALSHNTGTRVISFNLFSTQNPKPVYLNGLENSVCDFTINKKVIERFSTLCNTKDEPIGTYQITLVWALQSDPQVNRIVKTVEFTVIPPSTVSTQTQATGNADSIIKQYQNGAITQDQFINALKAIGWSDEYIRQAMAVIGKLPHQIGGSLPDQTQVQNIIDNSQQSAQENVTRQNSEQNSHGQENIQMYDEALVQKISQTQEKIVKQTSLSSSQNNWTVITIGASIAAAVAVIIGLIIAKKRQGILNK